MNFRTVVAVLALTPGTVFAHQDTGLKINSHGELEGLPEKYQPATFLTVFSQASNRRRLDRITLSVGGTTTTIPACASRLINTVDDRDIRASASWYHRRSTLPPYLSVFLLDPGQDSSSWPKSGFSLLFNLESSKLMRMEAIVARKVEQSLQVIPVDLSQVCGAEAGKFYVPLPPPSR